MPSPWPLPLSSAPYLCQHDKTDGFLWDLDQSLFCGYPPIHRPSSVLHFTYSFPSGHTTASTFMAGYLAFALLPPLIDSLRADKAKARDEAAGKSGAHRHAYLLET